MTWVKLDDKFPRNPKVTRAGDRAAWLYVCGLCYCAEHLTDGVIPGYEVARLTMLRKPEQEAERLVDVGLWEHRGDDFVVADYDKWNEPAHRVKERRAADRQRKESSRNPAGIQPESARTSRRNPQGIQAPHVRASSPVQSETPSSSSSSPRSDELEDDEDDRIVQACRLIAVEQLKARETDVGRVGNREKWLVTVTDDNLRKHFSAALPWLVEHPSATPEQLAAFLEPTGNRNPIVAAIEYRCVACGGSGWADVGEDGTPIPCSSCRVAS